MGVISMRRILIALAVTGCTGVAHADWQYTKWGMTKSEIIAASKGEVRDFRPGDDFVCNNGRKVIAVIPKKILAGISFKVSFCASADGNLSSIRLDNIGANTYQLRQTMISQYGRPVITDGDSIWNDKKSGNTVVFMDLLGIGTGAMIEYKPMGGGGL
jgi:hypothetical protein